MPTGDPCTFHMVNKLPAMLCSPRCPQEILVHSTWSTNCQPCFAHHDAHRRSLYIPHGQQTASHALLTTMPTGDPCTFHMVNKLPAMLCSPRCPQEILVHSTWSTNCQPCFAHHDAHRRSLYIPHGQQTASHALLTTMPTGDPCTFHMVNKLPAMLCSPRCPQETTPKGHEPFCVFTEVKNTLSLILEQGRTF